jgi:hypothetical protein
VSRRVQVFGAHSADFVWRAGGAIATAVERGGVAEVVASIRDCEELEEMGLPIWARWCACGVRPRPASGQLDVPVQVGGATIRPEAWSYSTPTVRWWSLQSASRKSWSRPGPGGEGADEARGAPGWCAVL